MPLYIGDYLADTSRLTTEQHGAYLLLIMDYWRNGRLPDDDAILANIARLSPESWAKHRGVLQGFFEGQDGEWVHERIEQEKDKSGDLKKAQIKKSIIGNYVKYGKIDPRVLQDEEFKVWWAQEVVKHSHKVSLKESLKAPPSPSPSPSPSPIQIPLTSYKDKDTTPPIPPKGGGEEFEQFWQAYPKKVGKDKAEASFKKLKSLATVLPQILEALEWQKVSDQWTRDGGQYIPLPTTYLNQGRWKDEAVQVAIAKRQPNKQELLEMRNLAVVHEMMRSA